MSGLIRSLAASAVSLPGLFSRNVVTNKKLLYSTCWNCLRLNNIDTKILIPKTSICSKANYSTQNIQADLVKYLDKEIEAEQNTLSQSKRIPSQLHGFDVKLDGANVTLIKQSAVETIKIQLNVNNSFQDEESSEEGLREDENESGDLTSKPPFLIEMKRGDTVLRVLCSYLPVEPVDQGDDADEYDSFQIDEIAVYKGEWTDTNYSVDGGILDQGVYDMLMGVLYEKGITNEFVLELSELCTSHEHTSYVNLLKDLKKFIS